MNSEVERNSHSPQEQPNRTYNIDLAFISYPISLSAPFHSSLSPRPSLPHSPLHHPHSRRQGGSSPSSLSTSSSAGAGEGWIPAAGRLLSLYLELGRCRGGPDPAPARADPATAASLRHGGAGPVAGRRGGRWTRALRGSCPVGRRRRLRLCEADCAWEGGDGCRVARGRRTRGGGGSLGRAVSMANWQGYVSISQFPAHLISDTRTRHGYVSVPYPYRIRIRHGIHVYPGVSVFLRSSRQCKFRIVVLDFNFAFSDVSLSVTDLCKTQETFTILTIDKS